MKVFLSFKQYLIDFFDPNGSGYYPSGDGTGYEGINYKQFNDPSLAAHWSTVVFGILLLFFAIFSIIYFKNFWINLLNNKKVSKRIGICYLLIYPLYYVLQYLYFYLEIKGKPENNLNLGVGLWFLPLNISQITHIIYAFFLIRFNQKIFNIVFPISSFFTLLPFVFPKWHFSFEHFFYWEYYINHILIFALGWIFFLYKNHNFKFEIKKSLLFINILGLIAFFINFITGSSVFFKPTHHTQTNFLFFGKIGFKVWKINNKTWFDQIIKLFINDEFNSSQYYGDWIQSYVMMALIGNVVVILSIFIIRKIKTNNSIYNKLGIEYNHSYELLKKSKRKNF